RRRHTRLQGDWSSDVCSSDLAEVGQLHGGVRTDQDPRQVQHAKPLQRALGSAHLSMYSARAGSWRFFEGVISAMGFFRKAYSIRSEERRVGKECRSRCEQTKC